MIVDEAHHIRNADTYLHQAVRYFCDHAQAAVFLTATPVQLGSQDLFTLLNVLRPGPCHRPSELRADGCAQRVHQRGREPLPRGGESLARRSPRIPGPGRTDRVGPPVPARIAGVPGHLRLPGGGAYRRRQPHPHYPVTGGALYLQPDDQPDPPPGYRGVHDPPAGNADDRVHARPAPFA